MIQSGYFKKQLFYLFLLQNKITKHQCYLECYCALQKKNRFCPFDFLKSNYILLQMIHNNFDNEHKAYGIQCNKQIFVPLQHENVFLRTIDNNFKDAIEEKKCSHLFCRVRFSIVY